MQRALRWLPGLLHSLTARGIGLPAALVSMVLATACTSLTPSPRDLAASSVAAASAANPATAPGFSAELATLPLREAAFEQAWRIVQERFYDPAFNGVNWEAVRLRYLPQTEQVHSDTAFYALLGRMVGELRDSHTRVYNARDYRNRMDYVESTFGLRVAEVEGEVAIIQVLPDTAAARAGLSPGMVVETVNGEAARARLARLRDEAPADASPEHRLRGIYGRLIGGRANEPLVIEVRSAGEKGTLTRYEMRRAERDVPLVVSRRVLEGNIGYIAFNRFRPEAAADFGRALDALNNTDGLVLDLRGNPGGNLGAILAIAQSFFPESRHVLTRRSRGNVPSEPGSNSWPRSAPPEMRINASVHAYARPLAILVDSYTASSSELLATMLREQRGAWIVGRPSCGCVVAVRGAGYRLPGGGALYVAESGFVTPQGNRMEGAGMQPDREVPLTLADLRAGLDRDLAIAQEWIRQRGERTQRLAGEH
jgi:C-terminal peptidase prc